MAVDDRERDLAERLVARLQHPSTVDQTEMLARRPFTRHMLPHLERDAEISQAEDAVSLLAIHSERAGWDVGRLVEHDLTSNRLLCVAFDLFGCEYSRLVIDDQFPPVGNVHDPRYDPIRWNRYPERTQAQSLFIRQGQSHIIRDLW